MTQLSERYSFKVSYEQKRTLKLLHSKYKINQEILIPMLTYIYHRYHEAEYRPPNPFLEKEIMDIAAGLKKHRETCARNRRKRKAKK
jgi:hypothetical protein